MLIAVSCLLPSEEIHVGSCLNIEFIAILIKLNRKQVYITCSYIPPISDKSIYIEHFESIKSIVTNANPEDSVLVFGDFNLPLISWTFLNDSFYYTPIISNENTDDFINNLSDLCLFQINGVRNDHERLLDLVFVNEPSEYSLKRADPVTIPEYRYHPTLELNLNLPVLNDTQNKFNVKDYCYKRANYDDLNYYLNNTDWLHLLSNTNGTPNSIDSMIRIFYETVQNYMNECIPKFTFLNRSGPPWSTKQLSCLKNLKNKRYKKYKKTGLVTEYSKYSVVRAEYNILNTKLYYNYLETMKLNLKKDPKSFYKFVNSKRKTTGYPNIMKYSNCESRDDVVISNMFADFFKTTYSDVEYDMSNIYQYPIMECESISLPLIFSSDITNNLKAFKNSSKSGPDGIPSCILINCAQALAFPLSILFNTSIKHGYFPKLWKNSYIIPLFKSGNKSNVANYRGIAKLSAIPKLFEKCLMDYFCHRLSSIISTTQHGFKKGCSISTNLLHLTTLVNRGFVHGQHTDVIYTDFSKAFDKVNHNLLLQKLHLIGFTPNCLNWIKSYLNNRNQRVYFNNTTSRNIIVKSGVPQGSHLGPILFNLFINDLPNVIKLSNILMYADDVKIFLSYNNCCDQIHLQHDLNRFYEWCGANLMELNLKKCKHMHFSRRLSALCFYNFGDYQLESVKTILDLGVLLDAKLEFSQHVTMTINKARGVLAFIKRWAKEFKDPLITKQLYTSLVRPILEFGSVIWDPSTNIRSAKIESVQKQFLLFCLRGSYPDFVNLPSYSTRLSQINLPSLKSRRTMLNVSFLINLINGHICSSFLLDNISLNVPQRLTRFYSPLAIPFYRPKYADADPFRRVCSDFNDLYNLIDFSLQANIVKRNIILFLNT